MNLRLSVAIVRPITTYCLQLCWYTAMPESGSIFLSQKSKTTGKSPTKAHPTSAVILLSPGTTLKSNNLAKLPPRNPCGTLARNFSKSGPNCHTVFPCVSLARIFNFSGPNCHMQFWVAVWPGIIENPGQTATWKNRVAVWPGIIDNPGQNDTWEKRANPQARNLLGKFSEAVCYSQKTTVIAKWERHAWSFGQPQPQLQECNLHGTALLWQLVHRKGQETWHTRLTYSTIQALRSAPGSTNLSA